MYMEDIYTLAVNLAGLPGLSTPAGLIDGMPVGLQLIGKPFDEQTILNAAFRLQTIRIGTWPAPTSRVFRHELGNRHGIRGALAACHSVQDFLWLIDAIWRITECAGRCR